jgi:hypothetical protein
MSLLVPVEARLRYAWNQVSRRKAVYSALMTKDVTIPTDAGPLKLPEKVWMEARQSPHRLDLYEVKRYHYQEDAYSIAGEGNIKAQRAVKKDGTDHYLTLSETLAYMREQEKQLLKDGFIVSDHQPFVKKVISAHLRNQPAAKI